MFHVEQKSWWLSVPTRKESECTEATGIEAQSKVAECSEHSEEYTEAPVSKRLFLWHRSLRYIFVRASQKHSVTYQAELKVAEWCDVGASCWSAGIKIPVISIQFFLRKNRPIT